MTTTTCQPISRPLPHPQPRGLRATVARRVLEGVARRVPVDILLPDGSLLGADAGSAPVSGRPLLEILDPEALYARLAREPKIGIGEGYMAGEWRPGPDTDLAEVLLPFAQRLTDLVPPALARMRRVVDRRIPAAQRNSPPARGATSRPTTTCPTTCSPRSWTRR